MTLITCYNRGCGKDFDPENNTEGNLEFLMIYTMCNTIMFGECDCVHTKMICCFSSLKS